MSPISETNVINSIETAHKCDSESVASTERTHNSQISKITNWRRRDRMPRFRLQLPMIISALVGPGFVYSNLAWKYHPKAMTMLQKNSDCAFYTVITYLLFGQFIEGSKARAGLFVLRSDEFMMKGINQNQNHRFRRGCTELYRTSTVYIWFLNINKYYTCIYINI